MVLAPLTVCIEPRMPPRAPRGWNMDHGNTRNAFETANGNPIPERGTVAQKFRTPERRSGLKRPTILAIYRRSYIAITALGLRENEA